MTVPWNVIWGLVVIPADEQVPFIYGLSKPLLGVANILNWMVTFLEPVSKGKIEEDRKTAFVETGISKLL